MCNKTSYRTRSKIRAKVFVYLMMCLKTAGCGANHVNSVKTPRSDLDLHCLLILFCSITQGNTVDRTAILLIRRLNKSV